MPPWLDVKPPVPQAAMRETPDVKEFLFNPMVDVGKKRDLLLSLANDAGLSKHTLNFLNLLLDSDRLVAVESIFDEFQAAYCRLTDTQARATELHSANNNFVGVSLRRYAVAHFSADPERCSSTDDV